MMSREPPFSPASEIAGEVLSYSCLPRVSTVILASTLYACAKVVAVGEGADDEFSVGDRVFGNALSGGLAPFAIMHAASAFKVHLTNFGVLRNNNDLNLSP